MRITEIADLAGTTPRAVRHYHRLGLLETPPTMRGRREYGVEHLARLLRIRWLAEQAVRIDELITRVEAGEALMPVPAALNRFYEALETRVRALGGDLRALRTERQMMQILGSLGLVPASTIPFIEAFDESELDASAQQITAFAHLTLTRDEEGVRAAHALAARTYELSTRHKDLALAVLDDLPDGAMGRALWRLAHVLSTTGYPHPAQQAFAARLLELLLADPDFATTIRRSAGSAGEDPVL